MENENQIEQTNEQSNEDYIETIKQLKANSVSKDAYLKIKEDNKKLLNALSSGEQISNSDAPEKNRITTEELRHNVFNKQHDNLSYWQDVLALRNRLIEEKHEDIFLPKGHNIDVTDNDVNTANKVADVVKQCIDYADGDSELFTNELMRRTDDSQRIFRR